MRGSERPQVLEGEEALLHAASKALSAQGGRLELGCVAHFFLRNGSADAGPLHHYHAKDMAGQARDHRRGVQLLRKKTWGKGGVHC